MSSVQQTGMLNTSLKFCSFLGPIPLRISLFFCMTLKKDAGCEHTLPPTDILCTSPKETGLSQLSKNYASNCQKDNQQFYSKFNFQLPCSDRFSSTATHFRPLLQPSHGLHVACRTLTCKKEM